MEIFSYGREMKINEQIHFQKTPDWKNEQRKINEKITQRYTFNIKPQTC